MTNPLIRYFEHAIAHEHSQRHLRGGVVNWDGEWTPKWVKLELEGLLREVNRQRMSRDLPSLSMEKFRRAETRAVGHSDYGTQLAVICAEYCVKEDV